MRLWKGKELSEGYRVSGQGSKADPQNYWDSPIRKQGWAEEGGKEAVVGWICTGATDLVLLGSWGPGRGKHQGRVSIQVWVIVEEWWWLDPVGEMD